MGANVSTTEDAAALNNDPAGEILAGVFSPEQSELGVANIEFLGMKFGCTLGFFKATIRETMEDLLFPIYIFIWSWVQIFVISGLLFPSLRSLGLGIRESWISFVSVMESTANSQWANYNLY